MLSKTINVTKGAIAKRGFAYTAATQPKVFINKHTKVICQGMTGKNGTFHTEQAQ